MDAAQVVERAERDAVVELVAASRGAEADVVVVEVFVGRAARRGAERCRGPLGIDGRCRAGQ